MFRGVLFSSWAVLKISISWASPKRGFFYFLPGSLSSSSKTLLWVGGDTVMAGLLPGVHVWWAWAIEMAVSVLAATAVLSFFTPFLKNHWWFPFPDRVPLSEAANFAYEVSKKNQDRDASFAVMAEAEAARRGGDGTVVLNSMANYIHSHFKVYGRNPPLKTYEYLGNLEGANYVFSEGGRFAKRVGSATKFAELVIEKRDMRALRNFFGTN